MILVPISKLIVIGGRFCFDENLPGLMQSIYSKGLLRAIEVKAHSDGEHYIVQHGNRRMAALVALNAIGIRKQEAEMQIPVVLVPD